MKNNLLILCCFATLFLPSLFLSCSEDDNVLLDQDSQVEQDNSTDNQINEDNSTTDSVDTTGSDAGVGEEFSRGAMLTNWLS